jgi:UDP-glucose 4-epimerase
MPSACVIGGAGFLGSHVADQLSQAGFSVCIFDRSESRWRSGNQQLVIGDVLDLEALTAATSGVDVVYNFAALADLNDALDKAIKPVEINVLGNVTDGIAETRDLLAAFVSARTALCTAAVDSTAQQAGGPALRGYQRAGLEFNFAPARLDRALGATNGLYRIVRRSGTACSYAGDPDAIREYIHVEDAARASVAALAEEFRNESVVLTGHQPVRVVDLLKMLAEILALPDTVTCRGEAYAGHYVRTPYAYQPKLGRKYAPQLHVDFGQGLLQLIDEVRTKLAEGPAWEK